MTTRQRIHAARVKQALKAGEELAFSPVDVLGRKRLSHTIAYRRGRYHVTLADGSPLGSFATFAKADHEGRVATAKEHAIDRSPDAPFAVVRRSDGAGWIGAVRNQR